jgi:hypothetical protein
MQFQYIVREYPKDFFLTVVKCFVNDYRLTNIMEVDKKRMFCILLFLSFFVMSIHLYTTKNVYYG